MKKLILIALALVGSLCGYSQIIEYPKNQVSIFYSNGHSLYTGFLDFFGGGTHEDSGKAEGKESWEYTDFSNVYNVEYLQRLHKPWLSIGVLVGYEGTESRHWINREHNFKPSDRWTEKEKMPFVIGVVQFDWIRTNWVGMYGKAGIGARFIITDSKYDTGKTDDDFDWIPCFVGATGIEVGPKFVRFFGELGIGAQGFASIGIRGRF